MSLEQTLARCSFCGRHASEVQRLIAGPGAVYICIDCLHLCNEILEEPAFSPKALELASRPPVLPPLKITPETREGTVRRVDQRLQSLPLSDEQKQREMTLILRQLDLYTSHFELHYLWLRPPLTQGFAFVPRLLFLVEDQEGKRWAGERGGSLQHRVELSPSPEHLVYQGVARFQPEIPAQSRHLVVRASDPLGVFEREASALWRFEIALD